MPSFAEELPVAWVMGSGHFFYCSGWAGQVSHLWFGSEFGNKFPLKIPNFSIFSHCIKKCLGQRWVGPVFTEGQKYTRVGTGQGTSLKSTAPI